MAETLEGAIAPLGDLVTRHLERHALTQEAAVDEICRLDGLYMSRSTLQRIIAGEAVSASTARTLAQWLPYATCEIVEAWRRQRGDGKRPPARRRGHNGND